MRYSGMKTYYTSVLTVFLSLLLAQPLWAQRPAIAPAPTPAAIDSTKLIRSASDTIPDDLRSNGIRVGSSILVPDDSTSRSDTTRLTAKQEAQIHKIIPRKATIRSLILPGLGQIYNRQYWKLPFIYGGLAAAIWAFQFNQQNYLKYNAAYDSAYHQAAINPTYGVKTFTVDGRVLSVTTLQQASNQYHQWRDLTVILTLAGWALNVVEANVAAHLKTFDLTDDISLRVSPKALPIPGLGLVPGVRVAFIFK